MQQKIIEDSLNPQVESQNITEEWKPILGFEGTYVVSNLGSVARVNKIEHYDRRYRVIKQKVHGGYHVVYLSTKGEDGKQIQNPYWTCS